MYSIYREIKKKDEEWIKSYLCGEENFNISIAHRLLYIIVFAEIQWYLQGIIFLFNIMMK
jgi:hypothetical protein